MGAFETFLQDLKATIIDSLRELIREEITQQTTDKWLNKKQLAEYWGVSESWINKNVNDIPHTDKGGIYFLRSDADAWRKGELKQLEVIRSNNVSIKNYKSNNFKVGR